MNRFFIWGLSLILIGGFVQMGCAKKRSSRKGQKADATHVQDISMPMDDMEFAALRGEDIPLMEQPDLGSFTEPLDSGVFQDIQFDYNQAAIKSNSRSVLDGIARWAGDNPAYQIMVEGHCDERGSNEYNLALGEQRALSVRRYLISLGVSSARLHTISYGEEKPVDMGRGESAWAKNRRAHFLISDA